MMVSMEKERLRAMADKQLAISLSYLDRLEELEAEIKKLREAIELVLKWDKRKQLGCVSEATLKDALK